MKQFTEHIFNATDEKFKLRDYGEVPKWNRLTIDIDDNEFDQEFKQLINDEFRSWWLSTQGV